MKFKEYLQEKLNPSQFREIMKMWKASGVKEKFDDVFGNKDRLYEPMKKYYEKLKKIMRKE
jgi:hypothetical protein